MAHPLIEEIRNSECWRLYKLSYPDRAERFILRIAKDLDEEWKTFLLYKKLHADGQMKNEMKVGDGRSIGVCPNAYATWFTFSRPIEIPAKQWLRHCMATHPELWLEANAYTKDDKNI